MIAMFRTGMRFDGWSIYVFVSIIYSIELAQENHHFEKEKMI